MSLLKKKLRVLWNFLIKVLRESFGFWFCVVYRWKFVVVLVNFKWILFEYGKEFCKMICLLRILLIGFLFKVWNS